MERMRRRLQEHELRMRRGDNDMDEELDDADQIEFSDEEDGNGEAREGGWQGAHWRPAWDWVLLCSPARRWLLAWS